MKLSIVTVNYRSWKYLDRALTELAPDFPSDWEMIVVDNESNPDTLAEFQSRFPWVNFVANASNSGFGYGCILGVAQAKGQYLLFMNPDVVTDCASVSALIAVLEQHVEVAILAPKQVDNRGRAQKAFDEFPDVVNQSKSLKALRRALLPGRHADPRATHHELTFCDWVTGAFLLVSRDDYDAIGGWSHDYWMYAEDADLCRRATDKGMRVAYTPLIEVVHEHGGSSRINVDVKSMTKLEVIISKHVYAWKHKKGMAAIAMHTMISVNRLPLLIIGSLADLVTFRQFPALRVRARMLAGLTHYYLGVITTRSWLSPRAKANQPT